MKRKQTLIILIPTFIFVVLWIIFSIYHGIVTSTISKNVSIQITPISPSFDTKVIDSLKQREVVNPIYEISGSPSTPTTQAVQAPISSGSAKIASSGGNFK